MKQPKKPKSSARFPGHFIYHSNEDRFLEDSEESFFSETFRAFRVFIQYVRGFIAFRNIRRCVTIFGSARFDENHYYYKMARQVGQQLACNQYTVMTGGGPGIMEAANRGAREKGGRSIGCNIAIPKEQSPNIYLDKWITFKYFFVRKVMLTKYSTAFIVMPGGLGTLDELFEMATLIQTGKIKNFPIVLMGTDFWHPLVTYLKNTLVKYHTIEQIDVDKLYLTDSPVEAVTYIDQYYNDKISRQHSDNSDS